MDGSKSDDIREKGVLSESEKRELGKLEGLIDREAARGKAAFLAQGKAFFTIRDRQLHRDHGTFPEYIGQRFGEYRRREIYRRMEAWEVYGCVSGPAQSSEAVTVGVLYTMHPLTPELRRSLGDEVAAQDLGWEAFYKRYLELRGAQPTTVDADKLVKKIKTLERDTEWKKMGQDDLFRVFHALKECQDRIKLFLPKSDQDKKAA